MTSLRKLLVLAAFAFLTMAAAGCGGSSSSGSSNGVVNITIWHGYIDAEGRAMTTLVNQFNQTHPKIHVSVHFYGNSDYALQKVLAAIAGGDPPDISYLYGSWAANIAESPRTLVLNNYIKNDPSFDWNDFWPAERQVATVNGKIVGVPALVDNLALVYNKKLFNAAGLAYPTKNWTWANLQAAAKQLTIPSEKQFGWAYVNDASEDTVWRFEALLWQQDGNILTPDGKHAAFDSAAGVKALTLLQQMAVNDHSVYLDSGNGLYANLFNSGHIGMLYTGPWDLSSFPNVDFGVQILPAGMNHQTISGPDNWVLFNNGTARANAAWTFISWFTSAQQSLHWSLLTGDLPIRASVLKLPGYRTYISKYRGVSTFVANLSNAVKVRPVTPLYPKISAAIGQAVQAVLLGKAQPQQALQQAAQQVNAILAAP
ncbi:MAG TPA: ABC transporter substrate-binding protein [Thermoleophilia bacterium]|nr:ABC transporter substrate-binding protein [Thermoleophilia bacterium]